MKFFVWGALAMSSLVVTLLFLHHWRTTRDRLFAFFAAAFGLLAMHWTVSALTGTDVQDHSYLLLIRLCAFIAIIAAVIDKNRRDRRPKHP